MSTSLYGMLTREEIHAAYYFVHKTNEKLGTFYGVYWDAETQEYRVG